MMPSFEKESTRWEKGLKYIAGVDEAGRGPLAGPVVAAAVILNKDFPTEGINDSKKLSKKKREALRKVIIDNALYIGIGIVSNTKIDEINILEASRLAMFEAIKDLKVIPDFILTDCMTLDGLPHESIVHGDQISLSIAAASIIAKTTRDDLMEKYDQIYPEYGFINHQGYGTKKHIEALKEFGSCPIHRKTFRPVMEYIKEDF